jgi:hypothetical protein
MALGKSRYPVSIYAGSPYGGKGDIRRSQARTQRIERQAGQPRRGIGPARGRINRGVAAGGNE